MRVPEEGMMIVGEGLKEVEQIQSQPTQTSVNVLCICVCVLCPTRFQSLTTMVQEEKPEV